MYLFSRDDYAIAAVQGNHRQQRNDPQKYGLEMMVLEAKILHFTPS